MAGGGSVGKDVEFSREDETCLREATPGSSSDQKGSSSASLTLQDRFTDADTSVAFTKLQFCLAFYSIYLWV